jgi:hypothetical protein
MVSRMPEELVPSQGTKPGTTQVRHRILKNISSRRGVMAETIMWYSPVGTVPLSRSTASVPVRITVRPYWACPAMIIHAADPGTAVSEGDGQWTYTGLPVPAQKVRGLQFGYNVNSYPANSSYICAVRLIRNRTTQDAKVVFEDLQLHLSSPTPVMYRKLFREKLVDGALTLELQVVLGGGSTSNHIFLGGIGIIPSLP